MSQSNSQIISPQPSTDTISTLLWGDLEPWMDEEYAKQVCMIMHWDPISVKVPKPLADPANGPQANNRGHCYLTFSNSAKAAAALSQIIHSSNPTIMPNSTRPFSLTWATSIPVTPPVPAPAPVYVSPNPYPAQQPHQFTKEYSIFVGDLAPEVSNSDLVSVFRNPVLGLRNDREPRFIRPFLSCKSAKIMLDPVTGVSRGYGFVRFTEEADQQRALIEMHGLYCLSRPMRISPATAKYKLPVQTVAHPPESTMPGESTPKDVQSQTQLPPPSHNVYGQHCSGQPGSANTASSSSPSIPNFSSSSTLNEDGRNGQSSSRPTSAPVPSYQDQSLATAQRYMVNEESWKHHAQARAILSNLIGPNGEQLSSSDPYNTTVFVGGLSPLISEETLRTFFIPFGEIHYVKVPAGKNCGFVQFIRKPDAERAIEKMQGFPIGGSRIRLSWGRSQYKAAQAAAEAAQTAAMQLDPHQPIPQPPPQLQSQPISPAPPLPQQHRSGPTMQPQSIHPSTSSPSSSTAMSTVSPEQAVELIQKLGLMKFLEHPEQLAAYEGSNMQ
ncbi:RNA-binding domain-containing protein [Thelephora ganbajun]|uniref:RNA-binding domain-containing protein n=1 Tax=Thelephora ganbajun TaxID=370292 RepID=A0ACB6ZNP1_THEGA|nr:RNA-binding domain-containing protein [Thelephora ganbajun]